MEKLRVPEEIFIDDLLELYPADDIKGFHKDKVYAVCDAIYRGMNKLGKSDRHPGKKHPYFVPLNTEILRKILGGNCYKGILDWMEAAGVIIPDGRWEKGKVSQGYRFTDFFLDSNYTWKTVTCKTILKKNVENYINKTLYFEPQIVRKLAEWFDPKRLRIDADKAYEVIELDKEAAIKKAKGKIKKTRRARITAMATHSKVENFEKGNFNLTQDGFGYRVHSALTQLPKKFRSLVTYDGKPLVEVDLSCSQLFFSCYLLNSSNWLTTKAETAHEFTEYLWKNIKIVNNNSINSNASNYTIMYINSLEAFFGAGLRNHPFAKKCCKGQLYESVVNRLDFQNYFPESYSYQRKRKKVKKLLLDQLFGNPLDPTHLKLYCAANKPILDGFEELYPEVAHVYRQIKQGYYKDLCRLLQRTESIAMLGFVCKRLQQDYPDLPIFTLHDCLITTEGNEDIIMKVMQEEITKYMGFTPGMKAKRWSEYAELIPVTQVMSHAA